ncbi:hypothetical protein OIU76_016235 [Salix suchowensis]|nr:hypothetical protein OIU76_016235 [Salix suchowensis]
MSRPNTGGWYLFLRSFSSSIHSQLPNSTPEANDLFNKVRVLSTGGNIKEALSLFYSTPQLNQSQQTYATLFHACARHGNLKQGQYLHQHMISENPKKPQDLFVTNHLINMFAKCGDLDSARQVFDEMDRRNVVSWTALISGYAQQGRSYECFSLFSDMLVNCSPNEFAFASVITSCDYVCCKQVHALALKTGLIASVYVGNALITRYSKGCEDNFVGDGSEACRVFESMEFRNLVSWNSMIAAFQHWKLGSRAIGIFCQMHGGGVEFDGATLVSVLSSLSESYDGDNADMGLKGCFQLHCVSIKRGFMLKIELATALVKAYSDLGWQVSDCYRLFMETSSRDLVSWTGIITAFADREPESAVFLFRQMYREGLVPDWCTFSIVLKACAGLVTERHALAIYSQVVKAGFEDDRVLANTLIHAYARCGSISFSKQVFDKMRSRDVVSWNSMIKAYALHGQAKEALHLFSEMNVRPDSTTMVALLSACSHAGLVKEGIHIFDSMSMNHGVSPQLDHYACMVDILGRAGLLFGGRGANK